MSLLWSGGTMRHIGKQFIKRQLSNKQSTRKQSTKNPFKNYQKPSPTNLHKIPVFAQKPEYSKKDCGCRPVTIRSFIEGISLPAFLGKKLSAGMTVEASAVLPLFLFFFLNMGYAMEMIRLHGNVQLALWETGSKLALYGYVLDSGEAPVSGEGEEDCWWKDLAGAAFTSTFVRARVIDSAGRDYLDRSPLKKGAEGLQFWESEIFGSGDEIDLIVTYSVSSWGGLAPLPSFRMANRYYGHIWNGYRLPGEGGGNAGQVVFVSENGAVYHRDRNCTHLLLSVRQVSAKELEEERNLYGGRYRACARCRGEDACALFYIAEWGDCYHFSRECPGIKRTVYSISLADAARYRPCGRCGNRYAGAIWESGPDI